jgi:hypothetical protein
VSSWEQPSQVREEEEDCMLDPRMVRYWNRKEMLDGKETKAEMERNDESRC